MTKLLKLLVEISSISNAIFMTIGEYSLDKDNEKKLLKKVEKIAVELRKVYVFVRSEKV